MEPTYELKLAKKNTVLKKFKVIPDSGFDGKVEIPETVQVIEKKAFSDYDWLITSVVLPKGLKEIKEDAFNGCSFESITFPEGLEVIGDYAFCNCQHLKEIIMPDSVTTLGISAFGGCEEANVLKLSKSLTTIPFRCFDGIEQISELIIPEGITLIEYESFMKGFNSDSQLKSVKFPSTLKQIEHSAFMRQPIKSIVIPNSVEKLDFSVFQGCEELEEVVLSDSLEIISSDCFADCKSLKRVLGGANVKKIENGAFRNCISLEQVDCFKTAEVEEKAFEGAGKPFYDLGIEYDNELFDLRENGTQLNEIKNKEFAGTIVIPESVKTIGWGAFEKSKCTSVVLPAGLRKIESNAFYSCDQLESIDFPVGLEVIEGSAFYSCGNLKKVVLPDSVTTIGDESFGNCSNLKEVVLPQSITTIDGGAFFSCTSLEEIVLPDSIDIIRSGCFSYCTNLKRVLGGANVKKIEKGDGRYQGAFRDCVSLEQVDCAQHAEIERDAFKGCPRMTDYLAALKKKSKKRTPKTYYRLSLGAEFGFTDSDIEKARKGDLDMLRKRTINRMVYNLQDDDIIEDYMCEEGVVIESADKNADGDVYIDNLKKVKSAGQVYYLFKFPCNLIVVKNGEKIAEMRFLEAPKKLEGYWYFEIPFSYNEDEVMQQLKEMQDGKREELPLEEDMRKLISENMDVHDDQSYEVGVYGDGLYVSDFENGKYAVYLFGKQILSRE